MPLDLSEESLLWGASLPISPGIDPLNLHHVCAKAIFSLSCYQLINEHGRGTRARLFLSDIRLFQQATFAWKLFACEAVI